MSENDYIAEYIKERYPKLLGFDFAIWKFARQCVNAMMPVVEKIKHIGEALNEAEDSQDV